MRQPCASAAAAQRVMAPSGADRVCSRLAPPFWGGLLWPRLTHVITEGLSQAPWYRFTTHVITEVLSQARRGQATRRLAVAAPREARMH